MRLSLASFWRSDGNAVAFQDRVGLCFDVFCFAVNPFSSKCRTRYRMLQLDAQSHMAAAQALTAERDRLRNELSKRGQKVKQLKKTVEAGQAVSAEQQRLQAELRAKAEQVDRARMQLRHARQKLKDRQEAAAKEAQDRARLLEQESARVAQDAAMLKNQRAEATEAAVSHQLSMYDVLVAAVNVACA